MKRATKTATWLCLLAALIRASASEAGQTEKPQGGMMPGTPAHVQSGSPWSDDLGTVAPALQGYTQERLYGEVWRRPGLSARDRSLATVAALIARDQSSALPDHVNQAIENGVHPREISETITHLAFYAGWANAVAAAVVAKDVFARRGIGADQIPSATVKHLPLDDAAEAQRAARVSEQLPVFDGWRLRLHL